LLLIVSLRLSPKVLFAIVTTGVLVGVVVASSPRLQRFTRLADLSGDAGRLHWSVNASFFQTVDRYPMGAGLGSASGTSIPGFLQPLARQIPTLENQYAVILLEQGVFGLLLWVLFLVWITVRLPPWSEEAPVATRAAWATTLATFAGAVIGTGLFSAIPVVALLFIQVGWSTAAGPRPQVAPRGRWIEEPT
jgi:hypothetical protein